MDFRLPWSLSVLMQNNSPSSSPSNSVISVNSTAENLIVILDHCIIHGNYRDLIGLEAMVYEPLCHA